MRTEISVLIPSDPLGMTTSSKEILCCSCRSHGVKWWTSLRIVGPVEVSRAVAIPVHPLLFAKHSEANKTTTQRQEENQEYGDRVDVPSVIMMG